MNFTQALTQASCSTSREYPLGASQHESMASQKECISMRGVFFYLTMSVIVFTHATQALSWVSCRDHPKSNMYAYLIKHPWFSQWTCWWIVTPPVVSRRIRTPNRRTCWWPQMPCKGSKLNRKWGTCILVPWCFFPFFMSGNGPNGPDFLTKSAKCMNPCDPLKQKGSCWMFSFAVYT